LKSPPRGAIGIASSNHQIPTTRTPNPPAPMSVPIWHLAPHFQIPVSPLLGTMHSPGIQVSNVFAPGAGRRFEVSRPRRGGADETYTPWFCGVLSVKQPFHAACHGETAGSIKVSSRAVAMRLRKQLPVVRVLSVRTDRAPPLSIAYPSILPSLSGALSWHNRRFTTRPGLHPLPRPLPRPTPAPRHWAAP